MSAIQPMSRPDIATRLLAGVLVPDTPLISRAIDFARELNWSSKVITNGQ